MILRWPRKNRRQTKGPCPQISWGGYGLGIVPSFVALLVAELGSFLNVLYAFRIGLLAVSLTLRTLWNHKIGARPRQ